MLYFEDFMEAIENLPAEINEGLTTVRQLDLLTQNIIEPLQEVNKVFFENCKHDKLSEYEKTLQHSELAKEYDNALSHCKEKREIVEKLYSMYKKLVRKLDSELEKFRLELEADNSGITEQIEQRINTLLGKGVCAPGKNEKKRQRFRFQQSNHYKNPFLVRRRIVDQACRTVLKSSTGRSLYSHKNSDYSVNRLSRAAPHRPSRLDRHPNSRKMLKPAFAPENLNHIPDGPKAPDEVRRLRVTDFHDPEVFSMGGGFDPKPTGQNFGFPANRPDFSAISNVKSDIEVDNESLQDFASGLISKNSPFFSLGTNSEINTPMTAPGTGRLHRVPTFGSLGSSSDILDTSISGGRSATSQGSTLLDSRLSTDPCPVTWSSISFNAAGNRERRSRSRRLGRDALLEELIPDALRSTEPMSFDETASSGPGSTTDGFFDTNSVGFAHDVKLDNPQESLEDDEDQKRYCTCHDVSYGDMIACDNPNCPYEWFHYSCVNLTVAPKGSWYCPNCVKTYAGTKNPKKRITRK
ncbi:unnamed protein product [Calicophoron daubneyi]|uniref:Inhibitor of growth protein n=1 Tax=Calicophoron daubneyi TaxID=300641 RepID=A0AAV2U002_CALDB